MCLKKEGGGYCSGLNVFWVLSNAKCLGGKKSKKDVLELLPCL